MYCDECKHKWDPGEEGCGQCPKCGYVNPSRMTLIADLAAAREECERLAKINKGLVRDYNIMNRAGADQDRELAKWQARAEAAEKECREIARRLMFFHDRPAPEGEGEIMDCGLPRERCSDPALHAPATDPPQIEHAEGCAKFRASPWVNDSRYKCSCHYDAVLRLVEAVSLNWSRCPQPVVDALAALTGKGE
jgi:hypothetical protein